MNREIKAGLALPELIKEPNELAVFFYSAATWNGHRIHWDREYARSEGHRDMVVQGTLQANWLVELVTSWLGSGARVTHLRYRNVGRAYVNERFVVSGVVREVSPPDENARMLVAVDVDVTGPSGPTTKGAVQAELPTWTAMP
jgi:acyl dehydratase